MTDVELVKRITQRCYLDYEEELVKLVRQYAKECIKASFKRIAEADGDIYIHRASITSEENIVLL